MSSANILDVVVLSRLSVMSFMKGLSNGPKTLP